MEDSHLDSLIKKDLLGQKTESEAEELARWMDASEFNKKTLDQLRAEWEKVEPPKKAINEEEIIDRIWDRSVTKTQRDRPGRQLWLNVAKVAASISLIAMVYLFVNDQAKTDSDSTLTYQQVEKKNISGQKSKLHLSDGTVVWLNAESTLSYTRPFKQDIREVELTGEGYFEVAKDANRPFIVKMQGTQVKVLGTSFNISSYQNEEHQVIALAEGKVEITHGDESSVITPGWITEINNSSSKIRSYEGNVSDRIAWTKDILLFKDASFKEVTEQLERWYGVKIEIRGQSVRGDMKFNGSFKDEYLENVLENLMVNQDMNYEIAGEKVFIYFN